MHSTTTQPVSAEATEAPGESIPCSPRVTDVDDLVNTLRAGLADYRAGATREVRGAAERAEAIATYRDRLVSQIRHDLAYTVERIEDLANGATAEGEGDPRNRPLIRDGFHRIAAGRRYLLETDMYESGATEEQYWIAIQQFYCDALDLTERLYDLREGRRRRFEPAPRSDGTFRRFNFLGLEAYGFVQTLLSAMEVAVPNTFEMRFFRTLWPTIAQMLWHQVIPWGELRWCDFERTTLGWLKDDGLARLRGERQCRVRFEGVEAFERNGELFDPATGAARHNVIVAASHRIGFLDFPLWGGALRNTPHAIWLNNSFYTPGMARKLARQRTTIAIRGQGKTSMKEALDTSARILAEDRLPILIIADGSQPNMMYGYQVRVKRGVRVLADECIRQSKKSGRRTFVVPLTFDDPMGYLCGLDDEIVTTLHPPIEVVSPSTDEPYRSVFDESAVNGGDALLCELEAIFLTNSLQARHSLHTPEVVAAVEQARRSRRRWGPRAFLRSLFNTSVFELSRQHD